MGTVSRYGPGMEPEPAANINYAELNLAGQPFVLMESAQSHAFHSSEGVSLVVSVGDQAELDYYWDRLCDGGEESRCGWLKDRFGVSWQVVPAILGELMSDSERAPWVTQAFMGMTKLDIATLLKA
jgi:predicted 3-demethylubiquinone-9 3-methyltransferase (glyoxalase superfamily)